MGDVRRRADHGRLAAMSLGFGFYLRDIADYNSIFGGLATVVVLIAYLYASAVVFLGGVQVDALVRALALGAASFSAATSEPAS